MVLLDVVYNHFGPEGNYLHRLLPARSSTPAQHTPWGAAINFDGAASRDGARLLRAQRAVLDRGVPLRRPAARRGARDRTTHRARTSSTRSRSALRGGPGRERHVHLVARERPQRRARTGARRARRTAAWPPRNGTTTCTTPRTCWSPASATATTPTTPSGRCGCSGARWPKASPTRASLRAYRAGAPRGEPSRHLPPLAFVIVPAEPRPGRQPRVRRTHRAARRRRARCVRARRLRAAVAARCRCSSWARSSPPARRSCTSAISRARWRGRVARAARRLCALRRVGTGRTRARPQR